MYKINFCLLTMLLLATVAGCATNSLAYPGNGEDIFTERNIGKGLTLGVLRNASVAEAEDENYRLFLYLRNLDIFGQVKWVDKPEVPGCDYVVHCTISSNSVSALYRERYVIALLTLGLTWLLGIPTHDSYAHYTAAFLVYRDGQCRHSYLLYNRRQYWWDNIYWRPEFTGEAAYAPLVAGFLYAFGRAYRDTMPLVEHHD
jgi:hypothetical protein